MYGRKGGRGRKKPNVATAVEQKKQVKSCRNVGVWNRGSVRGEVGRELESVGVWNKGSVRGEVVGELESVGVWNKGSVRGEVVGETIEGASFNMVDTLSGGLSTKATSSGGLSTKSA